jgi:hypothetical protein
MFAARLWFFWLLACGNSVAFADVVNVLVPAWNGLTDSEKAAIKKSHLINVRPADAFGLVVDTQGVNESTPGSSAGAAIGASFAEAAYIDHAFKPGNNYSAKNQLAIGILGALVGSTMDRPAVAQYHYRYAIKMSDGEIGYRDAVQSDPFRHAAGVCLDLSNLTPAPQIMCRQTTDDIRRKYLAEGRPPTVPPPILSASPAPVERPAAPQASGKLECKAANVAPVFVTPEQCISIGGSPL